MTITDIGCCGAYCKTCPAYAAQTCAGCKIGYENGQRDISKAKCRIKLCCMARKHQSCADCRDYDSCATVQEFYHKNGHKYGKYRQATQFIKGQGYDAFLEIADKWKNAHGKY